ncbi:phosphopentomutase [Anaerosalibacter bizertensis]|uniref:Phosphopentomutase n=1 Tax=Anaerosalibacter bizertensis TaxID=932217 RepID=A0A9Q4FLH2_9FIRM|nr:phosphopentomutase [Anaerosalibacter bizertensis]MBV1819264.1 phosphopentomutase [Bacteroidales bacterium MSK.15.36]MCB5559798.1 phosphopentomutase [Anaerosalibacter bizertensis]MCG4565776.1 phosphopentomutase [Anaerosalibacter bizertensis]MCG4583028.1 phosphopentomutase [Anaerosalibacter bizertensis]MCG4584835.1 phosphopentomutase [Anaerosalibacter bizertensis]
MKKRVILLVVDSLGIGHMSDVIKVRPQDFGANTFVHLLDNAEDIKIPNFQRLGINKLLSHKRLSNTENLASYGIMELEHYGADSYAGHQEIMGTKPLKPLLKPFSDYIDTVKKALEKEGYKVVIENPDKPYLLVNDLVVVADNIETDYGQIYNVTAPLDYISFEEVLKIGYIVRENVKVNRVIALGGEEVTIDDILNSIEIREDGLLGVNSPKSGVYNKGYQCRHLGYGVDPEKQISSILTRKNKEVTLIGKMQDVIQSDLANKIPAIDTEYVMEQIVDNMDKVEQGLIAATVQETDLSGHAQDVERYAEKLMIVDKYIGKIMDKISENDMFMITADHGNDPTIGHSQHTREKTFILTYGKRLKNVYVGERKTLSDISATIAEYFNVEKTENGISFLNTLV